MSDINNLKFQLGAEFETLVTEINDLKKRVAELEQGPSMRALYSKENLGHWIDKRIEDNKAKVTCNTNVID
jgi:hypothetical protein